MQLICTCDLDVLLSVIVELDCLFAFLATVRAHSHGTGAVKVSAWVFLH